jgi:hypothetical protein
LIQKKRKFSAAIIIIAVNSSSITIFLNIRN